MCVCDSDEGWGSAVCIYTLTSINAVFDSGAWVEQTRLESAWLRVNDGDVPTPRPAQVPLDTAQHHTSGVAKSSTSFGWGKGGNVTSAGGMQG